MENEITVVSKLIGRFERWVNRQSKNKAQKERERESAVEALLEAVIVTGAYLEDRKNREPKSRKKEMIISQLWSKAAIKVRRVDRRLSSLLAVKPMGWANPSLWSDPKFKDLPIQLDLIREQCIWLLENYD